MLKMEETTATIPILITATVLQLSAEVQAYLMTQYISVIYKPFDPNLLLLFIQQTLKESRQAGVIFSSKRTLPILVVDDREDLLDATTEILMLEGYQVASATNGMVALDAMSRAQHCLILLDLAMPVMNGFEFLSAYHRQLRPHSPVIILSGERNIQKDFLPPFVVDFLAKPFEVPHLLNLVERFAQRDMARA
jgi:CheY-like chemotaxis protein